jgi:hypothetical protein
MSKQVRLIAILLVLLIAIVVVKVRMVDADPIYALRSHVWTDKTRYSAFTNMKPTDFTATRTVVFNGLTALEVKAAIDKATPPDQAWTWDDVVTGTNEYVGLPDPRAPMEIGAARGQDHIRLAGTPNRLELNWTRHLSTTQVWFARVRNLGGNPFVAR